jgi:transposase-like protein
MASENKTPETLLEAIRYFADLDAATEYVASIRWPEGFICPHCGETNHSYLTTRRLWKCKGCKKQVSVKKGTIFEDSPIPLTKWLPALWLVVNCKNGISSYEVARDLGITQKSAWFVLQRLRLAMQRGSFEKYSEKFDGAVEVDETYIGGRARYQRAVESGEKKGPRTGKTAVVGFYERGGHVHLTIIDSIRKTPLQGQVRKHVKPGATVYTDELKSYAGLDQHYAHKVINHAEKYVDSLIHTNGLENFWSLLKRSLSGTYVKVEPYHLFRYLDEQSYRFNARRGTDGDRFEEVLGRTAGRRLTWNELTDKIEKPDPKTPRPVARFPMGPF